MVPRHSDPFPGGGTWPTLLQPQGARRPRFAPLAVVAAPLLTSLGSLLIGKALACAKARAPLPGPGLPFRCADSPSRGGGSHHSWHVRASFSSARCSAGPLCHVRKTPYPTLRSDWAGGSAASESALGRGPASLRTGSCVPQPAWPVPSTWVGSATFSGKLPEWEKKPISRDECLKGLVLIYARAFSSRAE